MYTPCQVQFSPAYPDRELNRLTTFFRVITAIPIVIVFAGVTGGYADTSGIAADGTNNPDAERDLRRGLPLVKWLLAIPHYVVLIVLYIASLFAVIAAWFAIIFTGRFPRGLFDYLVGVERWTNRVIGYALVLVTDRYPPFRLGA
jgi:hypothetical protein